ncbi:PAS domain-containing protein [Sphingomonas sp.]|uniref:PAS domain-containing protein n=1 Tax=Sphingomonas sp. TaxID=28214 RepID=UPI00289A3655|nr:PAS domain-containing protein [Sphingomonas sp.]
MTEHSTPSDPHDRDDVDPTGLAAGRQAQGKMDQGANEPTERPGLHHWRESTITDPDLDDRGGVFFAAIEMTRMPMILTDPNRDDNPIVFANKAFLDLTGYEEREILGRNCRFLQGAQTDREAVSELGRAVEARDAIALEILNYRRDGTPFWNAVFIGPVYDKAGDLRYFFASQLDVTRRRNSEQSMRQLQKMESIGQLTAGLAHDFNNLLQVVNGNLELAAASRNPEKIGRYLTAAQSAGERGAKLTRQLLAFARKSRLDPRTADLSEVVANFAELLESATDGRAVVVLDLAADLPRVAIDANQLEMALLNIVTNARDAMDKGGDITVVTCAVTLDGVDEAHDLPAGDYVAVEVIDEGEGMSPHVAERAVEPFFTTKGVNKGTGLGLAMASGFARQSGGRLEIESEMGAGTTVRLLFPAQVGAPASAEERALHTPAQALVQEGYVPRILVVEDNEDVAKVACEVLENAGYAILFASNGDEALRLFDATHHDSRIDLLFTDLMMPGSLDGLALADAVAERDASVSILLTTGYNEELVAKDTPTRRTDVLSKPYRQPDLLDRVSQALNRRGQGGERRTPSDFGSVEA